MLLFGKAGTFSSQQPTPVGFLWLDAGTACSRSRIHLQGARIKRALRVSQRSLKIFGSTVEEGYFVPACKPTTAWQFSPNDRS